MATPTTSQTDAELIRQYVRDKSESAFRILTDRHVNLVFGTAFRRTSDRGVAEEITQNVFIVLARKAAWLQQLDSLAAWLHQTTVLESRQWWRGETRRREREQHAAELETTMKTSDESPIALASQLDEALMELSEGDRQAVLLRFFEDQTHRQIGMALGIGEDAARKRVEKAMDQMTVLLRKRGVATGSVTGLAVMMITASHAAPAGLATSVAGASLAVGGLSTAPWLATLLGMSRGWVAGVCVAVCLAPVAWQQARLSSARDEAQRLGELLASLRFQYTPLSNEFESVRKQIALIQSQTNVVSTPGAMAGLPEEIESRLFRWDEKASYVRVPKSMFKRLQFDASKNRWGLHAGQSQAIDRDTGRVSAILMEILGLSADEKLRVQEIVTRQLKSHESWSAQNGSMVEMSDVADKITIPKEMLKLNVDSRVWMIPSSGENGVAWQAQFREDLSSVIGAERAGLFYQMASDDGSIRSCLGGFGAKPTFIIVTPQNNGSVLISQNIKGSWNYNTPVSISNALNPPSEEAFDDASVREEMSKRMEDRRAKFPDEEMPPLEDIIAENRWQFDQGTAGRDIIRFLIGKPLPDPVIAYLAQWNTTGTTTNSTSTKP